MFGPFDARLEVSLASIMLAASMLLIARMLASMLRSLENLIFHFNIFVLAVMLPARYLAASWTIHL